MKISKNKIVAITIALSFMLSVTTSMTLTPTITAHSPPWQIPTFMYCSANPNPIGVGQTALVFFWQNNIPQTANGQYGDRWNLNLTVTKPDGATEYLGAFTSDPIGTAFYHYVPNEVGNYTFVAGFTGGVLTNANPNPTPVAQNSSPYINDTYLPSVSAPAVLTVQETPIAAIPLNPLPTDYWTTPVMGINQQWYAITGNWLVTTYPVVNGYQPFSTAPNTAHIVWTKPLNIGGLVGGLAGQATVGGATSYYTGSSYETEWSGWMSQAPPIVINGILYYNQMDPVSRLGFYSVDLRTGQMNWYQNGTGPWQGGYGSGSSGNLPQLSFGQIYDYNSVNQEGAFPYLWSAYTNTTPGAVTSPFPLTSTVWQMYDASTGSAICNIKNVPAAAGQVVSGSYTQYNANNVSSIMVASPIDGSLLVYCFNPFAGWLALWNSSYVIQQATGAAGSNVYWEWRPYVGYTYDGRTGYQWNVTIPTNLPLLTTTATSAALSATMQQVILPGGSLSTSEPSMILGTSGLSSGAYETAAYNVWALGVNSSNRGQLLWKDDFTEPENIDANGNMTVFMPGADGSSGVFVMRNKETTQMYGYSLATGALLWGPTPKEDPWMMFLYPNTGSQFQAAYGLFYVYGSSGTVYCYNIMTGEPVWASATNPCGVNGPYPNWPFGDAGGSVEAVIADGKIYLTTVEHSVTYPMYQGWSTYCWNAYTGVNIWNITGIFGTNPIIANGYLVTLNFMNQEITCIGKGQSATTVTTTSVMNNPAKVLIKGTVTDQSPGQTCLGIPAAGTPAIADTDMTAWMQYLYLQYPKPTNVKGVPVTLSYIDPNNNAYTIGTTTSDMTGEYSLTFTPDVPGTYKIIAAFAGDDSYYSSTAQTIMTFEQPATIGGPTASPPQSAADMYFVPAIAGLFIFVAIIGATLIILMLRKRP